MYLKIIGHANGTHPLGYLTRYVRAADIEEVTDIDKYKLDAEGKEVKGKDGKPIPEAMTVLIVHGLEASTGSTNRTRRYFVKGKPVDWIRKIREAVRDEHAARALAAHRAIEADQRKAK